jgi:hypothetical protein
MATTYNIDGILDQAAKEAERLKTPYDSYVIKTTSDYSDDYHSTNLGVKSGLRIMVGASLVTASLVGCIVGEPVVHIIQNAAIEITKSTTQPDAPRNCQLASNNRKNPSLIS